MIASAHRVPVSVEEIRKARIRDEFHIDSGMGGLFTVLFIRATKYLITNPGWEQIIEFRSIEEAASKLYRLPATSPSTQPGSHFPGGGVVSLRDINPPRREP